MQDIQPNNPLEELSQLTGGLAHEIRNPLSTLRVNLQLLAEDLDELDGGNDHVRRSLTRVRTMQNEVSRLREILDDFIRFVGQHKLSLEIRDINRIIEELVEFYEPQAARKKVRLMTRLHEGPLAAPVDADLIKQALLNLFLNAQQAMPEGGDLMVRTQPVGECVRIDVADTGVGIPPEHLEQVFHAYFSTKKNGTGLGLAMTRRIVGEHGGRILVESQPGEGTQFSILLPMDASVRECRET
ncbi:MAG: two-component sensor histidine kinase [Phycisphaerae bacterium]|nr:two-component sensor histidine kinase [Phycisphaerae bacterium]